ncbi:MAG: VUT family protein [Alphaproteobacteria bacterium]|nr:MAG: VUT family protein [Alphaproteobacteria bacterium]
MPRSLILATAAMAMVVLASNILVQFLLGDWLTWGALTYPLAFLVTDIANRLHGAAAARRVVAVGFAVGVLCSLVASFWGLTSFRIALGSGIAFLTAQMVDIGIFDRLRRGRWWRAPLISSLAGSLIDTGLFFSIAFAGALAFLDPADPNGWAREAVPLFGVGPEAPLWVSLAIADLAVKLGMAALALLPFRLLTARLAA